MAERMSRRLVLLSSAAIGAVYLAGYLDTRSADAGLASGATSTGAVPAGSVSASTSAAPAIARAQVSTSTATSTTSTAVSTSSPRAAATAPAVAPPIVAPTVAAQPAATVTPQPAATAVPSGLRDGTYTGVGNSRRGGIQAALTITGGRITNVAITGASTQYPVSWISDLPPEVVANQSYQVDLVSGATYSSLAFEGAVRQAIAQAKA